MTPIEIQHIMRQYLRLRSSNHCSGKMPLTMATDRYADARRPHWRLGTKTKQVVAQETDRMGDPGNIAGSLTMAAVRQATARRPRWRLGILEPSSTKEGSIVAGSKTKKVAAKETDRMGSQASLQASRGTIAGFK